MTTLNLVVVNVVAYDIQPGWARGVGNTGTKGGKLLEMVSLTRDRENGSSLGKDIYSVKI